VTSTTSVGSGECALATQGLTVSFGGTHALSDFAMSVRAGERVGLIGPNGAGKSTFINAVTGYTRCSGSVELGGRPLHRMAPHRRARLGLVRTFQNLSLFGTMTVVENIDLGMDRGGLRPRKLLPKSWSYLGSDASRPRWSAIFRMARGSS